MSTVTASRPLPLAQVPPPPPAPEAPPRRLGTDGWALYVWLAGALILMAQHVADVLYTLWLRR